MFSAPLQITFLKLFQNRFIINDRVVSLFFGIRHAILTFFKMSY
jgi:hypothetical protein